MSVRVMKAIFTMQGKDFLKNMERLIMFIVFPAVAAVMSKAMNIDLSGMTKMMDIEFSPMRFFVATFATMHAIFAPIMVISTMVAEEKEKKTLRELMLANVSTVEYLISVGSFVLFCTIVSAIPFFFLGQYTFVSGLQGMAVIMAGALISIILGMSLGLLAPNAVSVNAFAMPAGMLLSFSPMLSGFNKHIYSVTKFTYGQRVSDWLLDVRKIDTEGIIAVAVNVLVVLILFFYSYHKNRRDS